ncbi:MAG TPA: protein kinase [Kofleriaceae bacterium]|nr:protein kinase [Kofleriaceae bacterium]
MRRGELVGERFEIKDHVASGGMGRVFRARDLWSGEIVALKMLADDHAALGPRFDREAKTLADLSHPGIVRYVAHGLTDAREPYLAMEWLEGEDLASRLARGRLSLEEGLALAGRVAEAIHAAHARGIVHRDLKPGNIFLVERRLDRVKVLDFGIARLTSGARLTRTGMIIGTPGYMAPEQAETDSVIDARADVFSLGCVLFECLTGGFAFMAERPMALLAKVLFAEPQRLRDLLPAAPPALDALLRRMLAKDPAARPSHGRAVAEELAVLASRPAAGSSAAESSAGLTLDEQRVFSIILIASEGKPGGSDPTLPRGPLTPVGEERQTLHQGVSGWGGRLAPLQDGSAVVALRSSGLVTDQAAQVARCALWLRAHVTGRPMALATGRGDRAGKLPAAEIIDRAAEMLVSRAPGAAGDGIAIDEVTARLLDARFDVRARGGGYVLFGEQELAEGARVLLGRPTPCVGRDPELGRLEQLFEECSEELTAQAALVTAPPGAGKSRLAQELLRSLRARGEPVSVRIGRGEPHRAGSAFGVLSQLLRDACGIRDGEPRRVQREQLAAWVSARITAGERQQVAEFLGEIAGVPFPDAESPGLRAARADAQLMNEQMRAAFVAFLGAELEAGPVVLVLEDLHWGDLPTVQFLDAALRELRDRPLLVLALARPEIHDLFPKLWADRTVVRLALKQLGKKASEQLVRHVLGDDLDRELVDRVVQLSEGNAFYLEELIRAAAEGRRDDLPETVVALVQSRLDALDDEARRILRAASVLGEVFWPGAVAQLLGVAERAAVESRLAELAQRELIGRRRQSRFPDEAEYTFRHALVREGAYSMLTAEDRVLGHRLTGAWLEQHGEQDPLALAGHFERGGEGARAGEHYLRAAEQAHHGADAAAGIAAMKHALGCELPDELRMRCLGMLCELLYFPMHLPRDAVPYAEEVLQVAPRGSGPWCQGMFLKIIYSLQVGALDELVALLEVASETRPAPGAVTHWAISIANGIIMLDLLGRAPTANQFLRGYAARVHTLGEAELLAQAFLHGVLACRLAYAEEDPTQGVLHAERYLHLARIANHRRYAADATIYVGMNRWYLGAAAHAEQTLLGVPLPDNDAGLVSAYRPFVLAWLLAERGSFDQARRWAARLVEAGRAGRVPLFEGRGHWALAEVHRREGALDDAEVAIQRGLELLRAAAPLDLPGALATLAALRLAQGRIPEAVAAAEEGRAAHAAMAACGFFRGAFLRLVHAECLEAAGDHGAATAAITAARASLLAIAAKLGDPGSRRRFLEGVPENQRTLSLARQWADPAAPAPAPAPD